MVAIASALVTNMDTLNPQWTEGMIQAGIAATAKGIPVVFDPVGVGATPYRNQAASQIIDKCMPTLIRGNASEIMAKQNVATKGVDSAVSVEQAFSGCKRLH